MQPDIINLTAMTRIALVFVILVVVVFAVHMLTKSKKFENSPVALPLCCLAALIVGFAGLYALSTGGPDPREIADFKPFQDSEFDKAAGLLMQAAGSEYLDVSMADGVGVSNLTIAFEEGEFRGMNFIGRFPFGEEVRTRSVSVSDDGTVWSYDVEPDGPWDFIDAGTLAGAISALDEDTVSDYNVPLGGRTSILTGLNSVPVSEYTDEPYYGSSDDPYYYMMYSGGGFLPLPELAPAADEEVLLLRIASGGDRMDALLPAI